MTMTSQFSDMTSHQISYDVALFFFSFAFRGVMKIFFYKGLARNSKIGIPPSEFCPISGDWGELDIKSGMNVCNKMLLNAAKGQGNSFYHFWDIKGNSKGGGRARVKLPLPRLGLKQAKVQCFFFKYLWHSLNSRPGLQCHWQCQWQCHCNNYTCSKIWNIHWRHSFISSSWIYSGEKLATSVSPFMLHY